MNHTEPARWQHVSLSELHSEQFLDSLGIVTSASGLRRALVKSPLVDRLRRAIASGAIPESSIRAYCERLMQAFERGGRFPHELALAALCIALEERVTPFVEEFLLDLARLDIVEMPLAPELARECLKRWYALPRAKMRRLSFTSEDRPRRSVAPNPWIHRVSLLSGRNRFVAHKFSDA
jgi:hypothetical protein